ncbi:hypothetical protein G9C85_05880 [Halorubellus sp. JP-L1]|uniref:hypothetical protein n=1 Tax=Halorubellus sp. JP-L1 TaxID=2715753 RepID=UPI00140DA007|nr:hypothetical protein [Halorubellus sp. JP-L1]NHN41165.1 hypothetical protein [Halorubellus sp. JP-L1]
MTVDDPTRLDRRRVLAAVASGAAASIAGCSMLEAGDDGDTAAVADDRARELAERFAPAIYFDRREPWFLTDPRPFESERDGDTVVDGFDALNGYVEAGGADDPPEPRVFFNVREYEDSTLAVVQFWLYSAFDQFTTNFHWHDWELLQAFVDTDGDDPQLYVASSHSRRVPNNEYLDPDPEGRPRVLSELGSHSSGLSVNADEDRFQRFPTDDDVADVTNSIVEGLAETAAEIPLAYGLPRDEGLTLPFAVPELDGEPVYEHERLPDVDASDFVPEGVTVRSFDALRSPPPDLPSRESGLLFEYEGRDDADADVTYDLVDTSELEHIAAFEGPQLSFEFAIPTFAEDAIASHITTTGVPWDDPRYENPASDVTDPAHRRALAERYDVVGEPAATNQVIAFVTNAVTASEAPDGEGLTTETSDVESVALLQSDPVAVPTFRGVAAVQDVPAGDHTLAVNGAGVAPHSEPVTADESGTTVAGVDGEIPLVARENAVKLDVDGRDADRDLEGVAVEDDFAGRLYDAPLEERDGLYVHRGGAFTTEVRDADDEVGAFRVNPGDEDAVRVEHATTGKTPLATYVADVAEETLAQVEAVDTEDAEGRENSVKGLARALEAVVDAARRAAERAEAGDRERADRQLETVVERLQLVADRLAAASDAIPDDLGLATDKRLQQARNRTEQARDAEKL